MRVPLWAQDLAIRVAVDEGRDDLPDLRWRRSRGHTFSSGKAFYATGRVVITAGTDRRDQKLVVLHELAHWLLKEGHTSRFWDKAWEFYRRYKVPILYAKQREGIYRKGALVAYRRSVKPELRQGVEAS